jgi:cytochrome c biogenesis protein CcmG/thiol:disulfide interchange protein DsbE
VNRDRTAAQAQAFLDELGNPYAAVVGDPRNRQSIEWGVYALPETFVLDGDGKVVLHLRGPINEPLMRNRIEPALAAASAE